MGIQKHWSTEEECYLESSWGNTNIVKIQKTLYNISGIKRSISAIKEKANRQLGGFSKNMVDLKTSDVADMLGKDVSTIRYYIRNNGLKARKKKLQGKYINIIKADDLLDWIYTVSDLINGSSWDYLALRSIGLDGDFINSKRKKDADFNASNSFTHIENQRLIRLYNDRCTYEEISRIMHKSFNAIRRQLSFLQDNGRIELSKNKLKITNRNSIGEYGWTKWQDEKLLEMDRLGCSLKEIADAVGKNVNTTKSRRRRLKIQEQNIKNVS